jgi:hypothetical protein
MSRPALTRRAAIACSRGSAFGGRAAIGAALAGLALALTACKTEERLPPPDPKGADMVEGALVAAIELDGTYRAYKITHIDPFPQPTGPDYHFIAYDPTAPTPEAARDLWKQGKLQILNRHIIVRSFRFLARDHRILGHEPVTAEELRPSTQRPPGPLPPG